MSTPAMSIWEREYYLARAARFDISEREHDVLDLLGLGLTNAEIGGKLGIAEETVKTHVGHVMRKLKAANRAAAAVIAVRERIIK